MEPNFTQARSSCVRYLHLRRSSAVSAPMFTSKNKAQPRDCTVALNWYTTLELVLCQAGNFLFFGTNKVIDIGLGAFERLRRCTDSVAILDRGSSRWLT